ncbi:hypothetical protein EPUL_000795 [Erysiphe pulchra]|uniref:Uncharacterized protein n=1 Tax=Erysiphe pulchra TaxID=225359 RepID=A0A2S4Q1Q1_9PEZI|nr:hypothetical protein EPUL_000795 [Erysiphe pulchra]
MPKFPKGFGRRKTIIPPENITEKPPPVIEQSFKVFDRSERAGKSFDAGIRFSRTTHSISGRTNTVQIEDDNLFENTGSNHSGASNTLTSVTDNSSRLSAVSTVPSSTDNTQGQEWTSPHDKPFTDIPPPPAPRKSTTFSLKTAGYAMSWGKVKTSTSKDLPPSPSDRSDEEGNGVRQRPGTATSHTSTTIPPKCYERDNDNSYSQIMPIYERRVTSSLETGRKDKNQDSSWPQNQIRAYPVPLDLEKNKKIERFTDAWSGQRSAQGLMVGASPSPVASRHSPRSPLVPPYVPPRVTSPATSTTSENRFIKPQENGIRSRSVSHERRSENENNLHPCDEDAKLLQDSINASRQLNEQSSDAQGDWTAPPSSRKQNVGRWTAESLNQSGESISTKRTLSNENIFDSSIVDRANLAQRYQERSVSPPKSRTPYTKVMTPAQFERYKQDQERLRGTGEIKSEEDGDDEEGYEDDGEDEHELEKAKAVARQRRKQEAHMAVYRQQMMKVIGEPNNNSTDRPNIFSTQSSPNLTNIGKADDTEEEDEEIPLGILQAHGFPSKNKPPSVRNNSQNSSVKVCSSSGASSGIIDPRLPVFARNLPQDPYYGSGIVRPMQRESMAFSGGSSANSGGMMGLPPGGLVGVIATEERSRAMRRGSPIPQSDFMAQTPPITIGVGQNTNESPGGMLNMLNSGISSNSVAPPMMLTPGDQAQIHMTQQMQHFMQMQMHFMQMMAQGRPQSASLPQPPPEIPRPASSQMHQRSQTMMNQNSVPWLNRASTYAPSSYGGNNYAPSMYGGNNYAPSIAPSERSNVGLPGRYRSVSQAPSNNDNRTRASSICGALQAWDDKNTNRTSTTIRPVKSKMDHASDEDEDEAWEKLTKKKKEKKSVWRTKKDRDPNGLKEMLNFLS